MTGRESEIRPEKKRAALKAFVSVSLLLLLGVGSAIAQPSMELLSAVSRQMGESMKAVTGYSFQQRTAVQVNGDTKSVQLSQISFGADKQPLITPISSEPSDDTGRGLRGLIKKEKREEMKEEVQKLVKLSNGYLKPNQDTLLKLASQAQVFVSPDSGDVKVDVSNLLEPGDHMTMLCDGTTKNRKQTQVRTTTADGNPMTITADYQTLPAGLNYNAQTVINVPAKGLQIMINTMNYQRQ